MRLTTSLKAKAREAKGIWRMEHIHLHNLKDITIEFPIGNLVVIAGVAGSGKSSLMESFYRSMGEDVVFVSQRAAGASLRSTPATYLESQMKSGKYLQSGAVRRHLCFLLTAQESVRHVREKE